jgi:hypothetical protein
MKISFYSFLFAFLVLTSWTAALPTPQSHELTVMQAEVRGYYDAIAARDPKYLVLERRNKAKDFFRNLGHKIKSAFQGVVNLGKKVFNGVTNLISKVPGVGTIVKKLKG